MLQEMLSTDIFLSQIKEDIKLLQENFKNQDTNIIKDEYAFNYWVLSRLYSIDEELIKDQITEYDDKNIDCYVFYPDSKELYLIQNKFYSESTSVSRNDVSDFLRTPLTQLLSGEYKRSIELQEIFNSIYKDPEAKIFLHFYVTNNKEYADIRKNIESFNIDTHGGITANVLAKFYMLNDIYEQYYGKNYKENVSFEYNLKTFNNGTFASLRKDYGIEGICEPYYIITPISEVYKMAKEADNKKYPLFEANIREFLGKNAVNNGIIATLKSEEDRKNFLYYNNGITITCSKIKTSKLEDMKRSLPLVNPQIVNGCQTVSSIKCVLENYSMDEIENYFKNVCIMIKALVIPNIDEAENKEFAKNVVRYTNRQNAVSDKAFATDFDMFYRMQQEFEKRGFLLLVKQSDKNKFNNKYSKAQKNKLLQTANVKAQEVGFQLEKTDDIVIQLEKVLQIFLALKKDGYFAYSKKPKVLKKDDEVYKDYSTKIHDYMRFDNIIKLYLLFKRADIEKSRSADFRTPIPYYLLGFLNKFLQEKSISYDKFFDSDVNTINSAYSYLKSLTSLYKRFYKDEMKDNQGNPIEYNQMIKKPIEPTILEKAIVIAKEMNQEFPSII